MDSCNTSQWVAEKDDIAECRLCEQLFIRKGKDGVICSGCREEKAENIREWVGDDDEIRECEFCSQLFIGGSGHEEMCALSSADNEDEQDKHIEILGRHENRVKRFGLKAERISFKLKPVPAAYDPLEWINGGVESLLRIALRGARPNDQVGICINSVALKEPAWCSFREAEKIDAETVLALLEKVIQSNQLVLHDEPFSIETTVVKVPEGKGKKVFRKNNFNLECVKRKGIIYIENNDDLCLLRALVVAKALADKHPTLKEIVANKRNLLDDMTNELLEEAGIDVPLDGFGLREVIRFQSFFTNYKITVYKYASKGRVVLYEGDTHAKLKINLLYHQNHFNVIRSLTAAFACGYYCEHCHVPYNTKNAHKCISTCYFCNRSPACEKDFKKSCNLCGRAFPSEACYNNHLQSSSRARSVCEKIKRCITCNKIYELVNNKPHQCGNVVCPVCRKDGPKEHICYVQKDIKEPLKKDVLFIFFDLETYQDKPFVERPDAKVHEPNLCVSQQVCLACEKDSDIRNWCRRCGIRQQIFRGKDCVNKFLTYVFEERVGFKSIVCISHNGQSFDNQFILKSMIEDLNFTPDVILKGTKAIVIKYNRIKFLDSINYLPMALAKLPQSFNLKELKKGYFPYYFNSESNQNYVGPLPAIKYYGVDSMHEKDRDSFLTWYNEQVQRNVVFDMTKELVDYCVNDVQILREACIAFRKLFIKYCNVCPFSETAVTLASAVNLCYRRNYLLENTLTVVPKGGYRYADSQSRIALKWLLMVSKERSINIRHAGNSREFRVPGTNLRVDGYCPELKEIFQFHGCFYHGHNCFNFNRDKPLYKTSNETLNSRYETTKLNTDTLKALGYIVNTMWECNFTEILKRNKDLDKRLDRDPIVENCPLELRDALYGGRTGNTRLYYKVKNNQKIKYYDICSLYPWVCKYGIFPIKEPKIYIGNEDCLQFIDKDSTFDKIFGIIKCTIIPPKNLYHPVLPFRVSGKLFFTLCSTCSVQLNREPCTHDDTERALTGTWVTLEIRKAIQLGYVIDHIYEIYSWDTVQLDREKQIDGLFTGFINTFLKIKQEASGWPSECENDRDKQQDYLNQYLQVEGIRLDSRNIEKNPGLRSLAKLNLNSFWGKHAQRTNLSKTSIVNQPRELLMMLTNPVITVNYIQCVNEDTLFVNWNYPDDSQETITFGNIAIAAFVTAQARLKLYSYLEQLQTRVLYYDTDSVIYTLSQGELDISTGNFLGDMTDELLNDYGEGAYITEFVSTGPKSYAFRVYCPNTRDYKSVCKVKGLTLNYENSKVINFSKLKHIVLNSTETTEQPHVSNMAIKRTKTHSVYSEVVRKKFKLHFTKRRLIENFNSVPYGYDMHDK